MIVQVDIVDTITILITVTIITRILKIYVGRILLPIPNGITNIMLTSISNRLLEVSAIIQRIELVFILAVILAMTRTF